MHAAEERGLVMTDASLLERAKFSFYSVTCNMMYFARAIVWNKDRGDSCESIIIGTFIHTFGQLWYAWFMWTLWIHFECQIICFGWRHLVTYWSMLRFILFGVYSQKNFLRMDSYCLFVSVWVVDVLCVSQETRCIILFISSLIREHYGDHTVDSHCSIRICDKLVWPHSVALFLCANLTVLGLALGWS